MIEPNTQAWDEITLSAICQGFINPIEIDNRMYLDIIDYWKIKDLEW
jgi:hypothetical protein